MIKEINEKSDTLVSLGFAEKPQKNDFDYENFPSKLGGLPVRFNLV